MLNQTNVNEPQGKIRTKLAGIANKIFLFVL
jgi:hypothetical protein